MSTLIDLATLGSNGFVVEGGTAEDRAGRSISGAGDINGDGFDDIIIGAPYNDAGGPNSGSAYVLFGGASGLGSIDLGNLSLKDGFRIQGERFGEIAGISVSGGGDVNGDGFDDVLVAANRITGHFGYGGVVETYVIFGKKDGFDNIDLANLSSSTGFKITSPFQNSYYQSQSVSVSNAGDVNGDGFDDILIGTQYAHFYSGAAYVVFGKAAGFGPVDLANLAPADGFAILGSSSFDQVGRSVSGAGDINGDGYDDLIIGAPNRGDGGPNSGGAYVIFGKAGGFGTIELGNLSPAAGFLIEGGAASDNAGASVSAAGDVNGDGFADLIVGAPGNDDGGDNAGQAYVIFGKANGFANISLSNLGAAGFVIRGDDPGDFAGFSVSGAGDVNHDGFDDVIVGAIDNDSGRMDAGRAYVIFGRAGGFGAIDLTDLAPATGFVVQGAHPGDLLGWSVSGAGDVNGDGFADILAGTPFGDVGGSNSGLVYVVSGHGAIEHVRNDVNGDGRSDILWRSDNGTVYDWTATASGGFTANIANFSTVMSADWQVAGIGDFNGDGISDLLWRQAATGHVIDWLGTSNGGFVTNGQNFDNALPADIHIVGVGDFDGDGRSDILLRKDDGTTFDWLGTPTGGFASNSATFSTVLGAEWQAAGTGDFNGDGRADVLWRSTASGQIMDWLGTGNGGFVTNGASMVNVGLDWHISGTGDFNGDGRADILWRQDGGATLDWLGTADGGFISNSANFSTVIGTEWRVVGIGDYDGDGRSDILWRQDGTNRMTDWLGTANGGFATNGFFFDTTVAATDHVQDPFLPFI